MKISRLERVRRQELLDFLSSYEKFCVTLVSEIRHGATCIYIAENSAGSICDAFSFFKGSTIHHCLPDAYGERRAELKAAFEDFFAEYTADYLFSVTGEKAGTELIKEIAETVFSRKVMHAQDYFLMRGRDSPSEQIVLKDAVFKRCTEKEFDETVLMQIDYEKEEVLFGNVKFNENVCFADFENLVDAGAVYIVESDGHIVSKASVSAEGMRYAMIGGVFTKPEFRKLGFAGFLVKSFVRLIKSRGRDSLLFVKTDNFPALRLYDSCGFRKICDYKSVYFERK